MAGDPTAARDAMLTRMAMATPGGPMFRTMVPRDIHGAKIDEAKPFDEAQAYATGVRALEERKGLISHPVLLHELAKLAVEIRRQLEAGETVILTANGRELARFEP